VKSEVNYIFLVRVEILLELEILVVVEILIVVSEILVVVEILMKKWIYKTIRFGPRICTTF